jgi:hypothetical protein
MTPFERSICRAAAQLSEAELRSELDCARRCALESTRARRELALLRARCLRLELERRALRESAVLAGDRSSAAPV